MVKEGPKLIFQSKHKKRIRVKMRPNKHLYPNTTLGYVRVYIYTHKNTYDQT